ncbi:hypothetical protein BRC64_00150 [Halobacteriales archaeon QH_10_67_22]|nr:MAG: hypothetical protein BRC64_00150 [Halobacteriales archaeon QH_10_67_22]
MDETTLSERIAAEYDGCDEDTADRIASKAGQYDAEVEANRTAEDWIAFMRDSDLERAVDAWNWAVGYVDSTHWDQGNPYKMDP